MVKVSDLIAEFLKEKEIEVVFGIIGSANSHIFDSINKLGYTKIINTHHEQAAVMAMGAYYRASGKLSATIVTAGGGASNCITGVVSNWADSIPGIIISGNESSVYIKEQEYLRMYGTQGFNIAKMVKDVTKYSHCLLDEKDTQSELEKCYNICGGHEQSNLITIKSILDTYFYDEERIYNPSEHKLDVNQYLDFSYSRKGQDVRYALNDNKLRNLGWKPKKQFDQELPNIIEYYKEKFIW